MKNSSIITKFIDFISNMSLSRVALFGVVLTAGYFFTLYDTGAQLEQSIEAAKTQWEVENNKKIETNKILKKEQQMKANVELFGKKFEEIKSKIPVEFTESELREIVVQKATENKLVNKSSSRANVTFKSLEKAEENLIEQVALNYSFEGTYANISHFVSDMSKLDKIIKIGDFRLSEIPGSGLRERGLDKPLLFEVVIIGFKQYFATSTNAVKKKSP